MPPSPRAILDLTKPLNTASEIYRDGAYSDPDFTVRTWCNVADQGFWVSRLELGTQTGTHIDAPAHFLEGGATLEALDLGHLIGPYFQIGPDDFDDLASYGGEAILFLLAPGAGAKLAEGIVTDLIALGCKVWAVVGTIEISDRPPLYFHQLLARAGIYLIEDLDEAAAHQAPRTGQMIALPLRLEGVSGSPCRVVVTSETLRGE